MRPVLLLAIAYLALGVSDRVWQSQSPQRIYDQARSALEHGHLREAFGQADAAFQLWRTRDAQWAWRFRVLKAELLLFQGKHTACLALLQQEIPTTLLGDEAAVRQRLLQSLASSYLQQYEQARQYLDEAERLPAISQPVLHVYCLEVASEVKSLSGDIDGAERTLRQALPIARADNLAWLQELLSMDLGFIYDSRHQTGEAILWFREAQHLAEARGDASQESIAFGDLGWSFFKTGNYDLALAMTGRAEALARQLGQDEARAIWLDNLGVIHAAERDYQTAAGYFLQDLEVAGMVQDKNQVTDTLNDLALVNLELRRPEQAAGYARDALRLAQSVHYQYGQLRARLEQARILAAQGAFEAAESRLQQLLPALHSELVLLSRAQSLLATIYAARSEPAKAEEQFRLALASLDSARATLHEEEYRLSFFATARDVYDGYIEFLARNGRAREALQISARNRARTLIEGLGQAGRPGTPAQDNFDPQKAARRICGVILSYWLKPGQSYLWAVTSEKIALFRLPEERIIDEAVHAYRQAIGTQRDLIQSDSRAGEMLYKMLVAPAQQMIPAGARVIIIPDGSLHALNFETLLVPAGIFNTPQPDSAQQTGSQTQGSPERPHYWLEDVSITNAASIGLLGTQPSRIPKGQGLLLIGDPIAPAPEFPELPQAKLEIESVRRHFATAQRLVVSGERATPSAYDGSRPGRFAYIHFVAHGIASSLQPLDSGIVLSRDGDNYELSARDIIRERLQADVVTVSACESAGIRSYSGEGLIGLSWAFLRAGARHVIASLWDVNDESTAQLMDSLYDELGRGQDAVAALRAAKLKMLQKGGRFRRPYYWAAFQVYTGA